MSRAAVVVNPTKLDDYEAFRKSVVRAMEDRGWGEPLWQETTPDDPGRGQAEAALSAAVDLLIACGGDGTVTACAEGVAGSGVPLAVIPLGTGNLLARNVGVPMGPDEALEVALDGVQQPVDAGRVNGKLFVVMAGLGLDARMLDGTSEPLKKRLGWLAYALTAVRHLGDRPMRVTVRADGGRPRRLRVRLASVSSLGPLAVAALGVGLAHRNRRAGVNFLTRFWPGTVLAPSGVKLNVVGAEHLTERRPAVFLFNFRTNIDVFLVAALVKDNWTGVATRELVDGHVFGELGKLLDVAFVDRGHPGTAASLEPLQAAARNGLSVLIAPEGARFDTKSVGPFTKRAFLIAMATGLPIVPIVIRNSESVAGGNAATLNPGTVDIAVLPPISVEDWSLRDLRKRIEQIRAAYLAILTAWPEEMPRARVPQDT